MPISKDVLKHWSSSWYQWAYHTPKQILYQHFHPKALSTSITCIGLKKLFLLQGEHPTILKSVIGTFKWTKIKVYLLKLYSTSNDNRFKQMFA